MANNVREFQWDSLRSVHEYALAKGFTHLEPLFPFSVTGDVVHFPAGWGTVQLMDDVVASRTAKKYTNSHNWTRMIGDVAFHFVPYVVDDAKKIISNLPTIEAIKAKYPDLLAADINYDTVKSRSWATTDPVVNIFLAELYKTLAAPPVDAHPTKKRREDRDVDIRDAEDKDEFFPSVMWSSFTHCLSWVDKVKDDSSLFLTFQKVLEFSVGGKTCTAKVDMALMKKDDPVVFVFEELKRLFPHNDVMGQKQCESIAVAFNNRSTGSPQPQEVFGIGIQHTRVQFCHALIPTEYMEQVNSGKSFSQEQYITLKVFLPGVPKGIMEERSRSQSYHGLDLTDPDERATIVQILEGIGSYIREGVPLIGIYKLP